MLMREHGLLIIIVLFGHIQVQDGAVPGSNSCVKDSYSCVCSYEYLKNDLAQIILQSTRSQLLTRLKSYTCQDYRRLPEHLTIVSASVAPPHVHPSQISSRALQSLSQQNPSNPRLSLPKQRYIRDVGEIGGEISKRVARNIHPHHAKIHHHDHKHDHKHLPPRSPHEIYVSLGHEAKVPCKDNAPQSSLKLLGWHHYDGRPVYAPGVQIDAQSGSLIIPSAQLNDMGIYNCSYKSWSDGREVIGNTVHQLSVYTDPISWYHVTTLYETRKCHATDSHGIKRSISRWIKDYVCPDCTTHDQSVRCVDGEYSLEFAVTAFNFPEKVQPYLTVDPDACSEECRQSLEALLLKIIKDSILKLFLLPIWLPSTEKLNPIPDSTLFEHIAGCLSGFQFHSPYCRHYSSRGDSDCPPCDHGYYQPSPGASSCIPCDDELDTLNAGATALQECISSNLIKAEESVTKHSAMAIVLMFLSALFIVAIIGALIYCWCCRESEIGAWLRKHFCSCSCKCLKRSKSKRVREATANIKKGITRTRSKIKQKLRRLKDKLRQTKSDTDYTELSTTSPETLSSDQSDATWVSHKPLKSKLQSRKHDHPPEIIKEKPNNLRFSSPQQKIEEIETPRKHHDASKHHEHHHQHRHKNKKNRSHKHHHHHRSRERHGKKHGNRSTSSERSASRESVAVATFPQSEVEEEQRYEERRPLLTPGTAKLPRNPGRHDIEHGGRGKHGKSANVPRAPQKETYVTKQSQTRPPPPPPMPRDAWYART